MGEKCISEEMLVCLKRYWGVYTVSAVAGGYNFCYFGWEGQPDSSTNIHAFTATATKEVQADILGQLKPNNPHVNIALVDRQNLFYRVMPRTNIISQIVEVLGRHPRETGIIYCLRRDDVDNISAELNELGAKKGTLYNETM